MNAIEIEEAVSNLAASPCDLDEFPFAFLAAFGNKEVTIKKLRAKGKSTTNKSDVHGGVLQRLNIHIAVSDSETLDSTLTALRESSQTAKAKAKYVLATDGEQIAAEELSSGEVLSCRYDALGDNFGFFLTLAGISAVREVKDNPIDIKATSRLNKLYVELLKSNPDWATPDKQIAFNQFLSRLVFCFFAEDTGVFSERGSFTNTIMQMTVGDGDDTHQVLQELFKAMDSDPREGGREPPVKSWADRFPYVNGGLFSGATDCPIFTRSARSYLLRAGELDWQAINPDIFGSMIQAVADDEERGSLGMHYTSVPNIEKVLNPLFIDSLNEQLEAAGDNARKLINLRKRLANIRVFDPACGSGNFLVIAYIRMREIEAELMKRRGEPMVESIIQLTQFYGIEIKPFAVEVARLSMLIAEFQSNVRLIGQMQAQMLILPLHETGHVVAGNALRIDWKTVCPPKDGYETYICGNPPYKGSKWQSKEQKMDLENAWYFYKKISKRVDYVSGWIAKTCSYNQECTLSGSAFVTTNSICQGQQAADVWPIIYKSGLEISFAHTPFKWSNLATHNAGVTVVIVGLSPKSTTKKKIFYDDKVVDCGSIGPYLIPNNTDVVQKRSTPLSKASTMLFGNMPRDGGGLFISQEEFDALIFQEPKTKKFIRNFLGSEELIKGKIRYCIWIDEKDIDEAKTSSFIQHRLQSVSQTRLESNAESTRDFAERPHRFVQIAGVAKHNSIVIPRVSSENRDYLPVDYVTASNIIGDRNFALYDAPLWNLALVASRIHWVWIGTVCVRMRTDFSYSNTLGWNTFPVPPLTEKQKADLSQCAENILLAREAHFPATIADLYKQGEMPPDLRAAHEHNDETLERIYIGRRFKNDTERLEKLFALYTEMTKESA